MTDLKFNAPRPARRRQRSTARAYALAALTAALIGAPWWLGTSPLSAGGEISHVAAAPLPPTLSGRDR